MFLASYFMCCCCTARARRVTLDVGGKHSTSKGLVFLPLLWFDCFLKGVLCLFLERWGSVVLDVLNLLWEVNGHQQALLLVMLKLFLAAFPGLGNCQTSVFLTDLRDQ